MKKGVLVLSLILVLVAAFFIYQSEIKDQITGKIITGNATSAGVAVSITITGSPSLEILKPENETYLTGTNLEFNFTAFSADTIKYNLDNGSNTTVTGTTLFNTTAGQHTLYLFANNSFGNASKNITFTVNPSKFAATYIRYKDNGSSTDFNKSSFEDIQNLSNPILEQTAYGKIAFNQQVNITSDLNHRDGITNIDANINISQNFIDINTTALPNFNKSATLSLYNLNFSDPRILKDGESCSSEVCTEVSYSSGIYVFNVTQFSNYSAEETPEVLVESSGSGGGGGGSGGGSSNTGFPTSFIVDKEQISITLQPGQVKTENVTITNQGKSVQVIEIENLIKDFIVRSDDEIILNPGESKVVELHAIARIETIPDIYLGKLIISSEGVEKEVLISIEVESKDLLLDVRAEILKPYKKIRAGEEILSEIRLFNLGGDTERKDVEIEYVIRDYSNKTIIFAHESLAIETQASFVKRFDIPKETGTGDYVLYVRAVYGNKVASSSDTFKIVPHAGMLIWYIAGTIVVVILLILIIAKIRNASRKKTIDSIGVNDYRKRFKRYK